MGRTTTPLVKNFWTAIAPLILFAKIGGGLASGLFYIS